MTEQRHEGVLKALQRYPGLQILSSRCKKTCCFGTETQEIMIL